METSIDNFSWRRVWMLFLYMLPSLKKQLILYPLILILFALICVWFYCLGWMGAADLAICNTLCVLMFFFAPGSLAKHNNRFIIAQMPAKPSEKFTFLLIYYWVVIGILTLGFWELINGILSRYISLDMDMQEIYTAMTGVLGSKMGVIKLAGILTSFAVQSFALFGVVSSKQNRLITAIFYSLGAYVGMCLLSGIIGGVIAILGIFKYDFFNVETGLSPADEAAHLVAFLLPTITITISLVLCSISAFLLCKTYKIIKHRGF